MQSYKNVMCDTRYDVRIPGMYLALFMQCCLAEEAEDRPDATDPRRCDAPNKFFALKAGFVELPPIELKRQDNINHSTNL